MVYLPLLLASSLVHAASETSCQAGAATSGSTTACPSTDNPPKSKWRWDPSSTSLPCNIKRISQSNLLRSYGSLGLPNLYPYPLIIHPDDEPINGASKPPASRTKKQRNNALFANLTSFDVLPAQFDTGFEVTLSGSDSLSSHRRTVPLARYLDELTSAGETSPDRLGNETWYLFGETFTSEWVQFLQNYELPSCYSCTEVHRDRNLIALSFGIGNIGSGVQWHTHGPGFSETIHGRKHWVLYPPEFQPEYDSDYASRHWMENAYPSLEDWNDADAEREARRHDDYLYRWKSRSVKNKNKSSKPTEDRVGPSEKKPWECTVREGEMIYFPDRWHHATINLEKYTVFVSSFTTEHGI